MKKIFLTLFFLFITQQIYSQEVIFEKYYNELPFGIRIENSGIYSIASFDINSNEILFSSFNKPGIFSYAKDQFKLITPDLETGSDFNKEGSKKVENLEFTFKKVYLGNLGVLSEKDGIVENEQGNRIVVSVPDRNSLIISSNISGLNNEIVKNFSNNLACADLIGIDKNGNIFVEVQKYLSEIPLKVQREVEVYSKSGKLLSTLLLPNIKYLYTIKDLNIDSEGNVFHLISFKDKVQIVKWSNLTNENSEIIAYPSEYNFEIHFNDFVKSNEDKTELPKLNNINLGVSRKDALRIADTYVLHQYNCTSPNLAPNGTTAPDGDVVKTPAWLVVGTNARIPYKWGGFSSLAQFDAGMSLGRFAGDINTAGVSNYAFGVDCSGYVSRCWQLTYHASTSYMPSITTQYTSWDDLKPGDAIHKVGHVRLFLKRNINGYFKVVESSARNWDVSYWSYSASDLSTYTPRYLNTIENNFNSQTPVLLSVNSANQTQVTLNWNCDSTNILGYRVYGSQDGNNWNLLLDENNSTITYANFSISNSEKYFRVSSIKNDSPDFSESYWSNVLGSLNSNSGNKVLIIDGLERESGSWQGIGNSFTTKYGNALELSLIDFNSIRNSEIQNGAFNLNDYQYVFWILSDESTIDETFNSVEQQLVKNYLENGGELFVSGSEIGWDLDYKGSTSDKDFYNNYLKADYVSDDAGVSSVVGITNSALDGCNFNIGQTYEEDYPDEIAVFGGSSACIKYSNNKIAGIQFSGYFNNSSNLGKLIHLAFPLETTADDESFNSVIAKSINFFNSSQVSVDEENTLVSNFSLEQNYPNPFNPNTQINFTIPNESKVKIVLRDVLGNEVKVLLESNLNPGNYSINLNGNDLSSGIYFYTLSAGNLQQTNKMVLIK